MVADPIAEKVLHLRHNALFAQIPENELRKLVKFVKIQEFASRKVIFHKGDPGAQVYLIVSGRVKITTLSEDGKEIVFEILDAGAVFGEISLLDGMERTATVTTMEKCRLLVLERRDFIPFLEQNPKVAIELLVTVCSRLRATDELIEDTLFRNLTARLAKKLLSLANSYGSKEPGGVLIHLKLSQQELGQLVGTSRESVNKQLRVWERMGLIGVEQRYITIHHPSELELLSQSAHEE